MRNAIILHGKPGKDEYYNPSTPSASNHHWIPWLQKQLLINEINAATPEIPHAFLPDYEIWKREFERYDISEETDLVGHSCGGGFLVRWLSEHKDVKVRNVVLVAPWIDPSKRLSTGFFEFNINPSLAKQAENFIIFDSDDDSEDVHISIKTIRESVDGATHKEFHSYGHFTRSSMGTSEFPELLDAVLN